MPNNLKLDSTSATELGHGLYSQLQASVYMEAPVRKMLHEMLESAALSEPLLQSLARLPVARETPDLLGPIACHPNAGPALQAWMANQDSACVWTLLEGLAKQRQLSDAVLTGPLWDRCLRDPDTYAALFDVGIDNAQWWGHEHSSEDRYWKVATLVAVSQEDWGVWKGITVNPLARWMQHGQAWVEANGNSHARNGLTQADNRLRSAISRKTQKPRR